MDQEDRQNSIPEGQREWVTAPEALNLFEALFLDRVAAKSTFADYLRDGQLRARAGRVFESKERKIGAAWKATSDDEPDEVSVSLEPVTWRRSKDWSGDQEDWRWPFGKFSITTSTAPFRRTLIQDVEFFREDVDRILRKRVKSAGGAPKRDEDWTRFWHAVIQIAKAGRLTKSSFQSQTELRGEILFEIEDVLKEPSIKPYVSQIWKKFMAD
jgi:hypothetical protein